MNQSRIHAVKTIKAPSSPVKSDAEQLVGTCSEAKLRVLLERVSQMNDAVFAAQALFLSLFDLLDTLQKDRRPAPVVFPSSSHRHVYEDLEWRIAALRQLLLHLDLTDTSINLDEAAKEVESEIEHGPSAVE